MESRGAFFFPLQLQSLSLFLSHLHLVYSSPSTSPLLFRLAVPYWKAVCLDDDRGVHHTECFSPSDQRGAVFGARVNDIKESPL